MKRGKPCAEHIVGGYLPSSQITTQAHKPHRAPPAPRHANSNIEPNGARATHRLAAGSPLPMQKFRSPRDRSCPVPSKETTTWLRDRDQGQEVRARRNGAGGAQSAGEEGSRQLPARVDRQTKAFYMTEGTAETAGMVIKKGHPVVQVSIYNSAEGSTRSSNCRSRRATQPPPPPAVRKAAPRRLQSSSHLFEKRDAAFGFLLAVGVFAGRRRIVVLGAIAGAATAGSHPGNRLEAAPRP